MDLKKLKKTWDKLEAKELDEGQLRQMHHKKTNNLIERIDRNIRIGFVILFVLIIVFALDDFIFSPLMIQDVGDNFAMPKWLLFLSAFSNTLIFTTFIYFVIKYYKVKRSCDIVCNLEETLIKIIDTLKIYQRLFYLAVITLLIAMGSAFITGWYKGLQTVMQEQGLIFSEVPPDKLITPILMWLGILILFMGGVFLLLRWGFRRLYGNYINKLKLTLKELQEIDE